VGHFRESVGISEEREQDMPGDPHQRVVCLWFLGLQGADVVACIGTFGRGIEEGAPAPLVSLSFFIICND
jgi:hypothetical protein